MARTPKLDAALAGAVDAARAALLEVVPEEQLGDHVGAVADGERLVTHRFTAHLEAYAGWEWYATLARLPRGKVPTVSEIGLLPGSGALLAPPWVPWSERVNDEELAAEREAEAAEAAAAEAALAEAGGHPAYDNDVAEGQEGDAAPVGTPDDDGARAEAEPAAEAVPAGGAPAEDPAP